MTTFFEWLTTFSRTLDRGTDSQYKKTELSQRWPRDAPNIWCETRFKTGFYRHFTTFCIN